MKRIFTLLCGIAAFSYAHSQVVISQIYGGGGNANATYQNDFVELFNQSSTVTVNLSSYTLQYAAAGSTSTFGTSNSTVLTGTIAPQHYFLIKLQSGGAVGATINSADVTNTSVNLSATSGKVALVSGSGQVSTSCTITSPATIIDLVGYGTATCYMGSTAAPSGSNTLSIKRNGEGVTNTNNNGDDFVTAVPAPRTSADILPLHLLSFTASPKANNVEVAWKTSNEVNTHHFEIEQSFDGKNFKSFATVAASGNTTSEKSYAYTTSLNATTTYYRLKMVDADGKSTISSIVKVAPSKNGFALGSVYPVPAKNGVTVEWNSSRTGATTLVLTDISGRTLKMINTQAVQGFNRQVVDVQSLSVGQYFLRIKNEMDQVQTIITKQ